MQNTDIMGRNSTRYQYFAAIGVNISAVIYGILIGWPSPTFPILESNDTPIESGSMTAETLSWIASIMCLGGLAGSVIFGYIVDVVGRRMSLWILVIPHILCYTLILLAENSYYLLVARFLGGLAGGGTFIVVPLYVAEISEDCVRGSLGSKLVFSCNLGILIAFVIGNYCSYNTGAIIYVCLPFLYFVAVMRLPETPYYLVKQSKMDEAEKSLAYFRNIKKNVETNDEYKMELENLKNQNGSRLSKVVDETTKVTYKDFVTRQALKAIGIGVGLIVLNQGCGCFAMLNYTATIFKEGGSSMTPNMSAIVVGVIQLIGSYISTILVDKMGRKFCLGISSAGTCIGLLVMGTYQYLKVLEYDLTQFSWIPVASFSFVIFIASWGILTLPFLVLSEIMPDKIRATAVSMSMTILWILAFTGVKYIYKLYEEFGIHGASYAFAACSFVGTIFIIFCVPETKGKSLEEIQILL